jgi:hypothetical protein
MTCRKFKKDMLLDIYGELDDDERRKLEDHLTECASCRQEFETTRRVLDSINPTNPTQPSSTPDVDWERSWRKIEASLGPRRRRTRPLLAVPRWAYAPLALAMLFVLGIVVGRYAFPVRQVASQSLLSKISPAAVETVLGRYFENVTPVLLDYAHDGRAATKEDILRTDRKLAASLLVENMLLRRALARRSPALSDLFDDLDMILTDISHLQSQDATTPASLREVISRRQVLGRIRRFNKV